MFRGVHFRPNMGPTEREPHRPKHVGQKCDIFWLAGPLYSVLPHIKVHFPRYDILWHIHCVPQKVNNFCFYDNFGKRGPISTIIISLLHLVINGGRGRSRHCHLTTNLLPHYLRRAYTAFGDSPYGRWRSVTLRWSSNRLNSYTYVQTVVLTFCVTDACLRPAPCLLTSRPLRKIFLAAPFLPPSLLSLVMISFSAAQPARCILLSLRDLRLQRIN